MAKHHTLTFSVWSDALSSLWQSKAKLLALFRGVCATAGRLLGDCPIRIRVRDAPLVDSRQQHLRPLYAGKLLQRVFWLPR